MTELLTPRAMGQDLPRRDGPLKVRGTAPYAFEADAGAGAPVHLVAVAATIARGRVVEVDTAAAHAVDGVLTVLVAGETEAMVQVDDVELGALQTREIAFRGQLVAAVLAETSEAAREAAALVTVGYDTDAHDVVFTADHPQRYAPQTVNSGIAADSARGDVGAGLADAAVSVRQTYTTAWVNPSPMEPHTTTALWEPAEGEPAEGEPAAGEPATGPDGRGRLTLWDSTQAVHAVRQAVAPLFGLDVEQVRVICPYVGGGFGAKGRPKVGTALAALAARAVPGRPVRFAVTRPMMFALGGYRAPTVQEVGLGADADGTLRVVTVDAVQQSPRVKEFVEQTAAAARMMYAAPHRRTTHRAVPLDVPVSSWFRAPGEAPGMFALEVAMDELAQAAGVDPVELRVRNDAGHHPEDGRPFSSRGLVECLRQGGARFGWADRDPRPGVRRHGDWLIGTGVAASTYPALRMPRSSANIRFTGRYYDVQIGAADLGTGAATVLAQIAADALGVDVDRVRMSIGDTDLPTASVAGGSSGTATWGTAIVEAATMFTEKFGADPTDGDQADGSVGANPAAKRYAMHAFGAQFVEVAVHADTAEIRVPRVHGTFACGRIVNPRTARSQFVGGMTMGLSMALHEHAVLDPRFGHVINHDLAEYHVAAHADVHEIRAHWIDEHDPLLNPMGVKGIGEIGIVGTAAAVSNAVWHATGVRVRDLPITLDKVLTAM